MFAVKGQTTHSMRLFYLATLLLFSTLAKSQVIDSLNTAKKCLYMTEIEREMIYEINRVRSNPKSYIQYLQPMLNEATTTLKKYGKGYKNYSVTLQQPAIMEKRWKPQIQPGIMQMRSK